MYSIVIENIMIMVYLKYIYNAPPPPAFFSQISNPFALPQIFNPFAPPLTSDPGTYVCQWTVSSLVQVIDDGRASIVSGNGL